jgi:hypothetical protein
MSGRNQGLERDDVQGRRKNRLTSVSREVNPGTRTCLKITSGEEKEAGRVAGKTRK